MCANRMSTLACGYPISDLDQDDHMKQPVSLSVSVGSLCVPDEYLDPGG